MRTHSLLAAPIFFLSLNANAGCDAILQHGLRNIEISESKNAVESLQYSNYCEYNLSEKSDSQIAQAHVEIFGQGQGGGSYNRTSYSNDIKSWCDARKSQYSSGSAYTTKSKIFYQGAVSAWDSCNKLNSADLKVTPEISPDRTVVDIGVVYSGPTEGGVLLYKVVPKGFSCKTATPQGDEVRYPIPVKNLAVQIHCERTAPVVKSIKGESFNFRPSATISIQSASNPFQLFFAEEYDPPAPETEIIKLRAELKSRELPVGTIVSSALPPDVFLSSKNPQYLPDRWVEANGKALPANSIYQNVTGKNSSPDYSSEQNGLTILDIFTTTVTNGTLVQSLIAGQPIVDGKTWKWFASGNDISGNRVNNDYEQDVDNFQTKIDATGAVIAQGRTLNWKHSAWGPWNNGTANVLGIATRLNIKYFYVKIN